MALGRLGEEREPDIVSVDLNPVILREGFPVAVDALVELGASSATDELSPLLAARRVDPQSASRPSSIPAASPSPGVSSHPGQVRLR